MAKLTPGSFAKKLRAFAKDLPRQQNEIKKAVALEIATNLSNDTPKDTGEAASGWVASLGSASGAATGTNVSGALVQAASIIAKAKPGDKIYITNNVDHIKYLNEGWSPQAPAGFIEAAISSGKALIQKQKLRYGVK